MRLKLILGGLLGLLAGLVWATCDNTLTPSATSRFGLQVPQLNSCGWGTVTNNNWGILDSSAVLQGGNNAFTGTNTFPAESLIVGNIRTKLTSTSGAPDSIVIGNSAASQFIASGYHGRPNIAIGPDALENFIQGANTSQGGGNVGIGYGVCGSTNSENTCIGDFAGAYNNDGFNNLFLGNISGVGDGGNSTSFHGSEQIYMGAYTGPTTGNSTRLANAVAIGYGAAVNCSNCMALGQTVPGINNNSEEGILMTPFNVGIGTDTPKERLHIVGNFRVESGTASISGSLSVSTTTLLGGLSLWNLPVATINTLTASTTGQEVFCTNCGAAGGAGTICVSTGSTKTFQFVLSTGTRCQ